MKNYKNAVKHYIATTKCVKCATSREILRRRSSKRSTGHEKHCYCTNCKKLTMHIEC